MLNIPLRKFAAEIKGASVNHLQPLPGVVVLYVCIDKHILHM